MVLRTAGLRAAWRVYCWAVCLAGCLVGWKADSLAGWKAEQRAADWVENLVARKAASKADCSAVWKVSHLVAWRVEWTVE